MSDAFNSLKNMGGNLKMVYGKLRTVNPANKIIKDVKGTTDTKNMLPTLPNRPKYNKLKNLLKK